MRRQRGPKIVEKGKLSDAVVVDVIIKKYLSDRRERFGRNPHTG
jgi:hypothetical protein